MKLEVVKTKLPESDSKGRERKRNKIKYALVEFINMNTAIVKVNLEDGEYKSVKSAYDSLNKTTIVLGYPIDVYMRNGEIYLVRTDMITEIGSDDPIVKQDVVDVSVDECDSESDSNETCKDETTEEEHHSWLNWLSRKKRKD